MFEQRCIQIFHHISNANYFPLTKKFYPFFNHYMDNTVTSIAKLSGRNQEMIS